MVISGGLLSEGREVTPKYRSPVGNDLGQVAKLVSPGALSILLAPVTNKTPGRKVS